MNFRQPCLYQETESNHQVHICPADRTRVKLLCAFAKLGVAIALPLFLASTPAIAQTPRQSVAQSSQQAPTNSQAIQLFVNPTTGNDTAGNGSETSPYKTITQALRAAEANTVIFLAPGTYSAESGETFPLTLKPGVTIQGDRSSKGRNIAIRGGAMFISPTFARQNIAILAADKAEIAGVTITNPNRRGYGLWIESSSPVVADNTFTGNSHDGISVTGNSAPLIRNNYFSENGANGITIYSISRPEVRNNTFVKTGFGINIGQNATPLLVENQIVQNTDGVVIQGKAQPILRGNTIENNQRDGLVALTLARPDLGISGQPGGNVFRNNGRYHINASTASQIIPAFGNQIAGGRNAGRLDLAGTVAQIAPISASAETRREVQPPPTVVTSILDNRQTRSSASPTTAIDIPVPSPTSFSGGNTGVNLNPVQPAFERRNSGSLPSLGQNTQVDIPPPVVTTESSSFAIQTQNDRVVNVNRAPLPRQGRGTLPAPGIEPGLLPVPGSEIPISNNNNLPAGDNSNLPSISVSQTNPRQRNIAARGGSFPSSSPPQPNRAVALGLRYRVLVNANSPREQRLVRSLVPSAFRTRSNGRVVIQVGAYGDRQEAQQMLQKMIDSGLNASIEEL